MTPVVIWGAGAIGGTIGAWLARDAVEVLFVDADADHVAAMNADGLAIEGPVDTFTVPARAATPDGVTGQHPLILLAVKAHHTEAAARALAPYLAPDGAVVSFQNGLNELTIANVVGRERTIGAFINFLADYQAPGRILYGGRGAVVVGELDGRASPRVTELHAALTSFEPEAVLTDNIFGYLWGKAAYGTLLKTSAIADATIVDYIRGAQYRRVLLGMIDEVLAVAAAENVTPLGFNGFEPNAFRHHDAEAIARSLEALAAYNGASAKPYSGVWRDIVVRKRGTDVAAQLAPVCAVARARGVPTPLIDTLIAIVGEVEAGRTAVGADAFAPLDALAGNA